MNDYIPTAVARNAEWLAELCVPMGYSAATISLQSTEIYDSFDWYERFKIDTIFNPLRYLLKQLTSDAESSIIDMRALAADSSAAYLPPVLLHISGQYLDQRPAVYQTIDLLWKNKFNDDSQPRTNHSVSFNLSYCLPTDGLWMSPQIAQRLNLLQPLLDNLILLLHS